MTYEQQKSGQDTDIILKKILRSCLKIEIETTIIFFLATNDTNQHELFVPIDFIRGKSGNLDLHSKSPESFLNSF